MNGQKTKYCLNAYSFSLYYSRSKKTSLLYCKNALVVSIHPNPFVYIIRLDIGITKPTPYRIYLTKEHSTSYDIIS